MSRRIACKFTVDAIKARTQTVSRRPLSLWPNLAPGDRLTLVDRARGRQTALAEVEVTDVRLEPLAHILTEPDGVAREGLRMPAESFVRWWLSYHLYDPSTDPDTVICRRIEWRYLDPTP